LNRPQNKLVVLIFAVIFLVAFTSVSLLDKSEQRITGAITGQVDFTIEGVAPPAPPPVVGAGPAAPFPSLPIPLPPGYFYIGNLDIEDQYDFNPFLNEFWIYTYQGNNYTLELLFIGDVVEIQLVETGEVFVIEEGQPIQIDSDSDGITDVYINAIDIGPASERPLMEIFLIRPLPLLKLTHFSSFILFALIIAILSAIVGYLYITSEFDLVRICGRCGSSNIKKLVRKNKKTEQKDPDTRLEFRRHKCLNCNYLGRFFPVIKKRLQIELQEEISSFKIIKKLKYPYINVKEKSIICGRCGSTEVIDLKCNTCKHTGKFFIEVPYEETVKLQKEINKLRSDKSYYDSSRNTNLNKRSNK